MPVPTQTRHPWRATVRTVFAATVGALSLLPTVAAVAGVDAVPLVAQAVAVSAAVTRVLALPGVDAWLRTHLSWLAAAPRSEVGPTGPQVYVDEGLTRWTRDNPGEPFRPSGPVGPQG